MFTLTRSEGNGLMNSALCLFLNMQSHCNLPMQERAQTPPLCSQLMQTQSSPLNKESTNNNNFNFLKRTKKALSENQLSVV